MAVNRADVNDADDWWASLPDERRVGYHRWLTGLTKQPPPPAQEEALIAPDGTIAEEAVAPGAER